jgi:hypothetical protein
MKALFIIPVVVASFFAVAAASLALTGVHINPLEPITAAVICAAAGIAGMLPTAPGKRKDLVGAVQLALIGTVLHLLAAVALAGIAIAAHLVTGRMPFMYWLLAGYWVSLVALVWQLRRALLAMSDLVKVQQ